MAAVPDEEAAELPESSVVSELHIALQEVLLEVHKATAHAAAHGKRPAEAPEQSAVAAQPLLEAARRFEQLAAALPEAVRRPRRASLQRELEELQAQDDEVSAEVEQLAARAEALRSDVDARWREACEELSGGSVTVHASEEARATAATSSSSGSRPGGSAASAPGCRGLRPKLQDLTQEKSRRFIEELEFVQLLANPEYVQWLAARRYFEEPAFLEFLKYLSYWRHPPHVFHVVYPQALRMLELLQNPGIRCRLHRMDARALLQGQMLWKWSHPHEVAVEPLASDVPLAPADVPPVPASTPARPRAAAAGDAVLREGDVLQDWTSLTGVVADKAWHERVEGIEASAHTVQHDATLIGHAWLQKNCKYSPEEFERAVKKFQTNHEDNTGSGDISKVLAAQHAEPLFQGWRPPQEAVECLVPADSRGPPRLRAPAESAPSAAARAAPGMPAQPPPKKRARRSS